MLKTKVEKLITDANGNVCGVEAVNAKGERVVEHGPVIITTGGFGADFAEDSLLSKHRPDLSHLPTTNGEHCTGDGLKMSMAVEQTLSISNGFRSTQQDWCTLKSQMRR